MAILSRYEDRRAELIDAVAAGKAVGIPADEIAAMLLLARVRPGDIG